MDLNRSLTSHRPNPGYIAGFWGNGPAPYDTTSKADVFWSTYPLPPRIATRIFRPAGRFVAWHSRVARAGR
jgi:hypothetical protein